MFVDTDSKMLFTSMLSSTAGCLENWFAIYMYFFLHVIKHI